MSLALIAVGWTLLVLPGLAYRWLRSGTPAETVALATAALASGFLALEAGLFTAAAPTVLRSAGLTGLAAACQRMFNSLAVGGPVAGWIAAAAFVGTLGGAAYGLLHARTLRARSRVEPGLGEHHTAWEFSLVILPTSVPVAYSVGGSGTQIVISRGLVRFLTDGELDVLLAHEAAHLRSRHDRYLTLGALIHTAARWLPGVVPSVAVMRVALERSADEDAAAGTPDRRLALRRALVATACAELPSAVAAFGPADGILERATALQRPPPHDSPRREFAAWTTVMLLTGLGVGVLAVWVAETHAVLAMAGYCAS